MYDENGNLTPETKEQALELVGKMGAVCKDYHPALVLFVLEAAMEEAINTFSPQLSELFTEAMRAYKGKAAAMILVAELLKGKADAIRDGVSVESLLAELGIPLPQELEPE